MNLSKLMDNEQFRLGLSLLSAASPTTQAMGFGERLGMGAQMFDRWRLGRDENNRRNEEQQQQKLLLQMKVQQLLQEQQRQAGIEGAYRGAIEMPAQQALAGGGGPTVANAQAMQGMAPRLNQDKLISGLMNADPLSAAKMLAPGERKIVGDPKSGIWDITDPQKPMQIVKPVSEPEKAPSSVQEYQFAVSQGYGGTYEQWVKDKARAGASNTTVSYGTPIAAVDSAGQPVFIQPTKDGSPPMIVPGVRPPKSAAEERSEQEQSTRRRQAEQMVSVLNDAETLLKQGTATASGVGTVADAAARAVGVTTKGAQDAARLQALSGWLVANVPRMEGPQSNYDVQNYMMMAGKVGDSTVPIPERMAALKTVRELQRKYAAINGTPMPEAAPEATKVRKYNPATGRLE